MCPDHGGMKEPTRTANGNFRKVLTLSYDYGGLLYFRHGSEVTAVPSDRAGASAALFLKRSDVQEPRAAEEPARRRHFHLHPVFASVIADDLYGQRVHKLPCISPGKYLVLIGP